MIEVMKEAFNVLDQLTFGLGRLIIIIIIPLSLVLRATLNIARALCIGERTIEIPNRSETARNEPPKVNLEKDMLDNDLKKYFNYDIKR